MDRTRPEKHIDQAIDWFIFGRQSKAKSSPESKKEKYFSKCGTIPLVSDEVTADDNLCFLILKCLIINNLPQIDQTSRLLI